MSLAEAASSMSAEHTPILNHDRSDDVASIVDADLERRVEVHELGDLFA